MVIISKQVSKATGSVISSQADHRQLSGYSLSAAHDPQQITPAALVFGRCKTFRRLLLASRIVPSGRANERTLCNVTTSWDHPGISVPLQIETLWRRLSLRFRPSHRGGWELLVAVSSPDSKPNTDASRTALRVLCKSLLGCWACTGTSCIPLTPLPLADLTPAVAAGSCGLGPSTTHCPPSSQCAGSARPCRPGPSKPHTTEPDRTKDCRKWAGLRSR
jgi:hypothetical protein